MICLRVDSTTWVAATTPPFVGAGVGFQPLVTLDSQNRPSKRQLSPKQLPTNNDGCDAQRQAPKHQTKHDDISRRAVIV
jgi:hypothetical protein